MASEVNTATQEQGLGQTVAKHYNDLKEGGLAERTKSRIFYLRNFNNWIKSMVISEYLTQIRKASTSNIKLSVLDLCSGKGGDLLKWRKGEIDDLVCADIAETSVNQCEDRYKEMLDRNPAGLYTAQFIAADCTKARLKNEYKQDDMEFDLVSCQFSFHYSFESYHQADMMLRNACECLKVGGYFIGTTPNSYELVKRLEADESDSMSFGNDVYRVTFHTKNKALFGEKYDFHLEGVVDCPEFLVYFPTLEKMAEKYGMKLVKRVPFAEYFADQVLTPEGRALIGRMQGLEPYPAEDDVELMSAVDGDYLETKKTLEDQSTQAEADSGDRRSKPRKVGTLSKAEWEATTIYLVFAFQKVSDTTPPFNESDHVTLNLSDSSETTPTEQALLVTSTESTESQSRKRSLDDNSNGQPSKCLKE